MGPMEGKGDGMAVCGVCLFVVLGVRGSGTGAFGGCVLIVECVYGFMIDD
jgi:hypothetical protein